MDWKNCIFGYNIYLVVANGNDVYVFIEVLNVEVTSDHKWSQETYGYPL